MSNPYKAIAQRINNAEESFTNALVEIADITTEEAHKVMNLYLKNKLAKLDAVNGTIKVKHGAFLEKDVILNAVAV